ncbi:MAG TPA: type II toxin-antitoxin system PemK/MazF family toxin [Thermoanaerobaculia bacterium]|nr:type II toxin-antitoxin system PemK/MazF family toxin [Thermoanaerobaculia bacterium]
MARILRGDVVWAELSPAVGSEQSGARPVVVLSDTVFNERSGTVISVAVTSSEPRAGFPLSLEITSARLPKRWWAKISQIRTLSTRRLGKKLAHLSPEEVDRIVEGLNEILGS